MDRNLKKIILISVLVLVAGGWSALGNLWFGIGQVLVAFFPFIAEGVKQSIEDYLTSSYFITGVIMTIASGFGIWFGRRGGKVLFSIVSLITMILSLVSIGANIL